MKTCKNHVSVYKTIFEIVYIIYIFFATCTKHLSGFVSTFPSVPKLYKMTHWGPFKMIHNYVSRRQNQLLMLGTKI